MILLTCSCLVILVGMLFVILLLSGSGKAMTCACQFLSTTLQVGVVELNLAPLMTSASIISCILFYSIHHHCQERLLSPGDDRVRHHYLLESLGAQRNMCLAILSSCAWSIAWRLSALARRGQLAPPPVVALGTWRRISRSVFWMILAIVCLLISDVPLCRVNYNLQLNRFVTPRKNELLTSIPHGCESVMLASATADCANFCSEARQVAEERNRAKQWVRRWHLFGKWSAELFDSSRGVTQGDALLNGLFEERTCMRVLQSVDKGNLLVNVTCFVIACVAVMGFMLATITMLDSTMGPHLQHAGTSDTEPAETTRAEASEVRDPMPSDDQTAVTDDSLHTPTSSNVMDVASPNARLLSKVSYFWFVYNLCILAGFVLIVLVSVTFHLLSISVLRQGAHDVLPFSRAVELLHTLLVLLAFYYNVLPIAFAIHAALKDACSFNTQFPILSHEICMTSRHPKSSVIAWIALPCLLLLGYVDSNLGALLLALRESGLLTAILSEMIILALICTMAAHGYCFQICRGPSQIAVAALQCSREVEMLVLISLLVLGVFTFEGGVFESLARFMLYSVFSPMLHIMAYILIPSIQSCWLLCTVSNHDARRKTAKDLLWGISSALVLAALGLWLSSKLGTELFEDRFPNIILLLAAFRIFTDGWSIPAWEERHRSSLKWSAAAILAVGVLLQALAVGQLHVKKPEGSIFGRVSNGVVEIEQVLMSSSIHLSNSSQSAAILTEALAAASAGSSGPRHTTRYALCDMEWHGLRLLDFALMSQLAYFDWNKEHALMQQMLPLLFNNGTGVPVIAKDCGLAACSTHSTEAVGKFYQFDFDELNASIIAIRGTDPFDMLDILEDIHLWLEPVLISVMSMFFPSIQVWPDGTVAELIQWIHRLQSVFRAKHVVDYFSPLESAISQRMKERSDHQFYVTGHSLGGGLANIVGAHLQVPAITFSPPGLMWSRTKFMSHSMKGAQAERYTWGAADMVDGQMHSKSFNRHGVKRVMLRHLAEFSISVLPSRDPVPRVDKHFGLVQNTICNRSLPMLCHIPGHMICDLIVRCGDPGRQRFIGCTADARMPRLR